MANGYSMSIMGVDLNNPIVMPQGVMDVIRVNENTPNLQLIQSFPVVSRNGNVHIHQDPSTGQMYEMTDEFHSMIPQILARNSSVMTGGVMPTSGGKILVGGNISTSLLREAPPQPTVSINGLPYKQTPKNGSIYSIFPEYFGGKGTTYIDGVIYKQNNIPSSDTQTIMSRRQINSSIQRQPAARIQFSYPSVQKSESSTSNRIVSVVTPYRHAYPSIK